MYKLWIVEENRNGRLVRQIPVFAFSAEDAKLKARDMFDVEEFTREPVEYRPLQ